MDKKEEIKLTLQPKYNILFNFLMYLQLFCAFLSNKYRIYNLYVI